MAKWTLLVMWIYFASIPGNVFSIICSRYPKNTLRPKAPVDDNFAISITGNAQTYLLGQTYNISLQAYNGRRFISAKLALENDNGASLGDLGHLEVIDPVESRFSPACENMIETTNTNPKTRLDLAWTAPTDTEDACVLIRATVIQHRDVWFMDDGSLTKRICKESVDDLESQKRDEESKECCACDEARYEITFEGVWSRNLHPKDFPAKGWLTKFSDILGAAHTSDYRFWDSGELASLAMQEFAQHGSAKGLEQELNTNFREKKVRTILKARGPSFPYLNSPTLSWVRVDPLRHQLSLASKIMPSPDWIVGVAGLELCLSNCTWLEEKEIKLYPWDIGTDAGPSYTSPDQPQIPPDVIRRIRSDYPSDPRSPFYDPTGEPMKPMAVLTIKRQRLYERRCADDDSNNGEDTPRECHTHPWSAWSECTSECGTGVRSRYRVFKQPEVAEIYNCDEIVERRQIESCTGQCLKSENPPWNAEEEENGEEDSLLKSLRPMMKRGGRLTNDCSGQWTPWSICNATCGAGFRIRKLILDDKVQRGCQDEDMYEYKKCFVSNVACRRNNGPQVVGDFEFTEENDENTDENEEDEANIQGNNREFGNFPTIEDLNNPDDIYGNIPSNYPYRSRHNKDDQDDEYSTYNNIEDIQAENLRQEQPFYDDYYPPMYKDRYNARNHQNLRNRINPKVLQRQPKEASYQGFLGQRYSNYYEENNPFSSKATTVNIPTHCFQPLSIVQCSDSRTVGNFWFYNFCTDECMLYAADICDPNTNKYPSMEKCEEQCAAPMRKFPNYLRRKQQNSPHCQALFRNRSYRGYMN
ncbi:spondin-1-like [Haematobia irritans]|uniref:spondin-1-like n=1 Tax=Haematobia irritans TaxID=7368 RepID=UPI003F4F7695